MFRFDRFLTLHVFRHLDKVLPKPEGIRIPILMYHSISDEPEKVHPYFWINTSPNRFAEHMQFLHKNNYKVISLSEAVRIIESQTVSRKAQGARSNSIKSKPLTHCSQPSNTTNPIDPNNPNNFVVLTFDDGYLDFYTNALPVLRKYDFTATVFLPTVFIGNRKPGLVGKKHLDWNHVWELQQQGIDFGSHTIHHRQLWKIKDTELKFELKESKEIIEQKIGKTVEAFSYPYWFPEQDKGFVNKFNDLLEKCGYVCATGTRVGSAHHIDERMILKRIPINSCDDLQLFLEKLSGTYDWIHRIQLFYKYLKAQVT